MRLSGQRLLALAFLGGVSIVVACGTDSVDIPPAPEILPDGGNDLDTSVPTDDGDVDDADTGVTCPPVLPDDNAGVYVTDAGANEALCGARDKPCKTITFGIGRAQTLSKGAVFVAQGTYVEHIVMQPGITVEGGWTISQGSVWTRICTTPEEATIIRAPGTVSSTVEAIDIGGVAGLSTLHVEGKAQANVATGDSIYGIFASGATTTVSLNDVIVTTANAGTGKNGDPGTIGAPGGAAGSCAAGTGVPGTPGATGTGAVAGSFDQTGWVPSAGTAGAVGTAGQNGTVGGAGACANCVTCSDIAASCLAVDAPDNCGTMGGSGCGGGAGVAGAGANGGGSSIGIFVWDATVQMSGGRVKVGDGGNGGIGGGAGPGGVASAGKVGTASAACTVTCTAGAVACVETKATGAGGTAGGAGGVGGAGGGGGGGAGGSSIAIYQGGAGVVTTTPNVALTIGKAGAGGGPVTAAGEPGLAVPRIP